MSDFNKAVEIALRTWYPKDHELHFNFHHPLGKLTSEWGELLDDYMKSLYKPGYTFEPLDELGDIWYYLRILHYQQEINYDDLDFLLADKKFKEMTSRLPDNHTEYHIIIAIRALSEVIIDFYEENENGFPLLAATRLSYFILTKILNDYNITLQQLTDSNWEKLKPGSERGEQWMSTKYIGGKVTKE